MDYMLLFLHREGVTAGDPDGMAEMTRYVEELVRRKKLRRGAPLAAGSEAARVRVHDGTPFVTDGPFAETKELLGGFWIVDVADRDERRHRRPVRAREGAVDVHRLAERHVVADSGRGTPFLLACGRGPAAADPGDLLAFGESVAREGSLLETASFADSPPPARVEARRGKIVVDARVAAVCGYGIVRVTGRDAAIELAKGCPHASRAPVEVREILFDRTSGRGG
jgi:hypothetical protein